MLIVLTWVIMEAYKEQYSNPDHLFICTALIFWCEILIIWLSCKTTNFSCCLSTSLFVIKSLSSPDRQKKKKHATASTATIPASFACVKWHFVISYLSHHALDKVWSRPAFQQLWLWWGAADIIVASSSYVSRYGSFVICAADERVLWDLLRQALMLLRDMFISVLFVWSSRSGTCSHSACLCNVHPPVDTTH